MEPSASGAMTERRASRPAAIVRLPERLSGDGRQQLVSALARVLARQLLAEFHQFAVEKHEGSAA